MLFNCFTINLHTLCVVFYSLVQHVLCVVLLIELTKCLMFLDTWHVLFGYTTM